MSISEKSKRITAECEFCGVTFVPENGNSWCHVCLEKKAALDKILEKANGKEGGKND